MGDNTLTTDILQDAPSTWRTEKFWSGVVNVTPEIAARWLEFNTGNRKLKPSSIAAYARDMAAGDWQLTGEPIKFAKSGRLLDGQNRLKAIIKSGATVPLLVVRGLDDNSQRVMDTGVKRTSSDDLSMQGEKNASTLAAIARLCLGVKEYGYADGHRYRATNSEIADFLVRNGDLRAAAAVGAEVVRKVDISASMAGYSYWRFAQLDRHDADAFFTAATTKVGLRRGDPVIAMCDRLADLRRRGIRPQRDVVFSIVFRAWNYRRDGQAIRVLRVNSANGGVVPVPEPK